MSKDNSNVSKSSFVDTDFFFGDKPVYKTMQGRFFYFAEYRGQKVRRTVLQITCDVCGKQSIVSDNPSTRHVCSKQCRYKVQSGPLNCNWRGPTKKKTQGYILKYAPEHPCAQKNFVLEHRLVMEEHLQRYLSSEDIVHHINLVKDDNRLENLFVCSRPQHDSIHGSLMMVVRELIKSKKITFNTETQKYELPKE